MCSPLSCVRLRSSYHPTCLYSKRPDFLGCVLGILNKTHRSLQSLLHSFLTPWDTHRHPLLLAPLLLSYKTFMSTFIKAIAEFSNQLYPITRQPFSVNYLYLVVGGVYVCIFFSCWTAPWCFLNSWVVCHSEKGIKAQHCYKKRIKVLSQHPGWFAPFKTLENRDNMLPVIWSYLLWGFVYFSCSHIIFNDASPAFYL